MRGKNPIRPPLNGTGSVLEVKHIFPTVQGEGPNAGVPSVFIRLGGCNLACAFCDTQFEDYAPMPVEDIVVRVRVLARAGMTQRRLVVITGGEPLRQPIALLCSRLIDEGFRVQIETNGTIYRLLDDAVQIVCSPKNTGQGYHPVRDDLLARVDALKFVVSAHDPLYGDIPALGQQGTNIPVYVQPMDEHNKERNALNLAHAIALSHKHGYHLSVQLHKVLGIE